ncbi:MAG TPA: hypothetical protein VG474_11885 [Solirubrobacteraceae bacterium]|nr:hypothetical protein [Solirubrobacteraceae bacterium]
MPTEHLLAFVLLAFVLIVVPGPSVLFAVARSLTLGRGAGFATVVGNTAGVYMQVIAVAFEALERRARSARRARAGGSWSRCG